MIVVMSRYAIALLIIYLISVVGGHLVLAPFMSLMRRTTKQPKRENLPNDFFWIGGTERFVATTLVILAPRYVGPVGRAETSRELAKDAGQQRDSQDWNTALAGRQRLVVYRRNRGRAMINWDAALRAWAN